MARVWKMKSGKWIVEVRKKGYPYISKAFWDLKVARKFGRDVESKMERNVFEDFSGARGTTLREILVKYRDERTAIKKGVREETSTIKTIMTQIERLARNCFSLELDCKKLGNTNINTPIM